MSVVYIQPAANCTRCEEEVSMSDCCAVCEDSFGWEPPARFRRAITASDFIEAVRGGLSLRQQVEASYGIGAFSWGTSLR